MSDGGSGVFVAPPTTISSGTSANGLGIPTGAPVQPPGESHGLGAGSAASQPPSESEHGTIDPAIGADCSAIVESFRNGEISRSEALVRLVLVLPSSDDFQAVGAVLQSYLDQIDSFVRAQEQARKRGKRAQREEEQPVPLPSPRPSHAPSKTRPKSVRSESDSESESSGDEDGDEEEERPAKRSRRSKVERTIAGMPWMVERKAKSKLLPKNIRNTQDILFAFSQDPKRVKALLATASGRPSMPSSEWDSLINGRAIDLDKVLTSQYSATSDRTERQKIGILEIILPRDAAPATRRVKTHSDWITAWIVASRATVFLFRHRYPELEQYGTLMLGFFQAWDPAAHYRLIEFDRELRITAANRGDFELTNWTDPDYSRLFQQYISAFGRGSGEPAPAKAITAPSRSRNPPPASPAACKRFNAGIPHTDCRYQHKCADCGGPHAVTACKGKAKA